MNDIINTMHERVNSARKQIMDIKKGKHEAKWQRMILDSIIGHCEGIIADAQKKKEELDSTD